MIAPTRASACVLDARIVVTTAGRFSGRAPIAKATAAVKATVNVSPRARLSAIDTTRATPAIHRICWVRFVELPGERGLDRLLRLQHPGDVADLGGQADGDDHELTGAPGDIGVLVHHVGSVTQRRIGTLDRLGTLGDRQALSGQRTRRPPASPRAAAARQPG
jgi:hypothetical protein